jgi:hypothetical protein
MVYGATGLVQQQETGSPSKRVKATRCAELIASAAAHGLAECWISKHPVLLMCECLAAWHILVGCHVVYALHVMAACCGVA